MKLYIIIPFCLILFSGCKMDTQKKSVKESPTILEDETNISISRAKYYDQLYGFWLGQCIAN